MVQIAAETRVYEQDFIHSHEADSLFGIFDAEREKNGKYSHVIMNPPYKKIKSTSSHRAALRLAGIETSNLYTGFMYLAAQRLRSGGEMVAIVPRSFCNGPYFKPSANNFFP